MFDIFILACFLQRKRLDGIVLEYERFFKKATFSHFCPFDARHVRAHEVI